MNPKRLQELEDLFDGRVHTIMSNPLNIESHVVESDLVIGAVLIPGAKAPKLVTEDMIKKMKSGSVVVDIAIDQGGILKRQIKFQHMMTQLILNTVLFIMPLQTCQVQCHVLLQLA